MFVEIARKLHQAGAGWEEAAGLLGAAARSAGVEQDTIHRMLVEAWRWAPHQPSHWTRLCREWIYVAGLNAYYHLPSKSYVPLTTSCALFQWLSPDPEWSISHVLFESGSLKVALGVTHGAGGERGLYEAEDGPRFNEP